MQRAVDQQTAQQLQPLTRPTLETMTTPADYNMFLAKWERYRDGCLKRHIHDASGIALQLWDCCPKEAKKSAKRSMAELTRTQV